ncbi:MAG: DUF4384 domain-containing protein [Deltaproteobacteria bacterium]|nr:DUF4384 domain-containing protein [Deltaproteobacteria bacterium]
MRFIFLTIHFALILFVVFPLHAAECQWVETAGEAVVENITAEEARQLALNRARSKAIEEISGLGVSGSALVKDFMLVADFIHSMSSGHVLKEEVLNWETATFRQKADDPPLMLYRVKLKSCVTSDLPGDPYFRVKGELNRQVFMAGEEATIKARCTKDCYITILNLTAENKIWVLLPNEYEPSRLIKAGEEYTFPMSGLSLEMQTLPGHKRDAEAFILVGTKERFDLMSKGSSLKPEDLYKALLSLPPDTRTEDVLVYEVRAKD